MMDIREQIQLVLDVISGKRPYAALQPIIDNPSGVNVFKAAVDHLVGKVLARQATGKNEFRFRVIEHGQESFTDWIPEVTQFSSMMAMGQLRLERPHAEIAIERRY